MKIDQLMISDNGCIFYREVTENDRTALYHRKSIIPGQQLDGTPAVVKMIASEFWDDSLVERYNLTSPLK